jgi:hypothetical protein
MVSQVCGHHSLTYCNASLSFPLLFLLILFVLFPCHLFSFSVDATHRTAPNHTSLSESDYIQSTIPRLFDPLSPPLALGPESVILTFLRRFSVAHDRPDRDWDRDGPDQL